MRKKRNSIIEPIAPRAGVKLFEMRERIFNRYIYPSNCHLIKGKSVSITIRQELYLRSCLQFKKLNSLTLPCSNEKMNSFQSVSKGFAEDIELHYCFLFSSSSSREVYATKIFCFPTIPFCFTSLLFFQYEIRFLVLHVHGYVVRTLSLFLN